MAKKSAVNRNEMVKRLVKQTAAKRSTRSTMWPDIWWRMEIRS